MTISELLTKLGTKAGLNMADSKFANLMAVSTEFPAEDATKILGSLFTIEDAKQNFDLKNWFTKAALDGADHELNRTMDEMGLELADKEELKAVKSTYERIGKVVKKIADLEKKKVGASTGEKKELQDQINGLTSKITEIQDAHKLEVKAINERHNSEMTDIASRTVLSSIKTIYDELPSTAKLAALEAVIKEKLSAVGAVAVRNGNVITLKQAKDPSLDWYDPKTNEKPSYEQFANSTLAESKILAVNDNASAQPKPQNGFGYVPPQGNYNNAQPINGNGGSPVNYELLAEMDADLKAVQLAPSK